ncbi:UMF1 family MFS transporter [Sphingobacterium alimentarium]|uniref:UMF1 family MFS transporter n=1 Tax=Sphingobacterium alimentarium TaxID=797292 RepID=A0A4R3VSV6_9SPHI|nr:MFS transporter [Sphingobacterium alimentarium]TCV08279.1 UMF1 family MFS transporter [Sphingobacterium alimentarium]
MEEYQKNDKKLIRSWAMFDWANSAYNLVITSTIFPIYYIAITKSSSGTEDYVSFFGFEVINTVLSNYALAAAYLIMVLALPFLSAFADANGKKLQVMKLFTYIGSIACMGLFFFKLDTLEWGIICFTLAAMGYIGGVAVNNSYLPVIATPDRQDAVSAKGFAYGYIGCVTIQLICFVFVLKPDWFGIEDASFPARLSFLLVGLWWLGFSLIPFKALPNNHPSISAKGVPLLQRVTVEFKSVLQQVRTNQGIKRFLPAYFFNSVGVQTIMVVATMFGQKELDLEQQSLIITIILIQLVAIIGAFIMSFLAKYWGNIVVLLLVTLLWASICISAYYLTNATQFYGLAVMVGLLMGGIQSLSRSTYSKMLPEDIEDTTAFFSFYDITEKLGIVVGLICFGLIEQITHNIRYSALSLSIFFILGFLLLLRVLKFNSVLKARSHE